MKRRYSRFRAQVLVPVAAAMVAFFSSCDVFNYSDPVDSRLYSSNLIGSIGFDKFAGADASVDRAVPLNGQWDFSYCYDAWADKFAYMTFAPVADSGYATAGALATAQGETLPSGLASDAPAYRLELVNLIAKGDFETGALTDSGKWTLATDSTKANATAVTLRSDADAASLVNGTGRVGLKIDSLGSVKFAPVVSAGYAFDKTLQYELWFRYVTAGSANLSINDNSSGSNSATSGYSVSLRNADGWNYYKGDYIPPSAGAAPTLAFMPLKEAGDVDKFFVDDFMLKRKAGMTLRLRLQPNQTSVGMIEGRYRFSVWVHADPLASATANPYPMDAFSVTMKAVGNGYNAAASTATFTRSMGGWRELTIAMETSALQFRNRQDTSLPVLEIDIDCVASLPGRVLLAAPDFRMIKE